MTPRTRAPSSARSSRSAPPRRPTTRPAPSRSRSPRPRRSCSTAWPACRSSARRAGRPELARAGHRRAPAPTSSPRPRPATSTPTRSARATPGARTARPRPTEGMPDTIVIKIVENETTSANLLLSGELNAAQIIGPDAERLDKPGLFAAETPALIGEQWYNHADGRATSDPARADGADPGARPRRAAEGAHLRQGHPGDHAGRPSSRPPAPVTRCPARCRRPTPRPPRRRWTKAGAARPDLPLRHQRRAAASPRPRSSRSSSGRTLGIKVNGQGPGRTALQQTIFGAGDWDVAWVPLNVNSPDQVVPFLSGPAAPNGTNFADIDNADYDAAVKKASAISGEDGCATWLAGRVRPVRRRGHRALRQQPGADLRREGASSRLPASWFRPASGCSSE